MLFRSIGWAAYIGDETQARGIYAMNLNDESIEKLADGAFDYLGVTQSTMYCNRVLSENATEIVARDIKTGEETVLTPREPARLYGRIHVEDKAVYALSRAKGSRDADLVEIKPDGSSMTVLTTGPLGYLSLHKGNLYYILFSEGNAYGPIYRRTAKGKVTMMKIVPTYASMLLVDGYIYATDALFRDISRIKAGGDIYYVVYEKELRGMNVIDKYAYLQEYSSEAGASLPCRFKVNIDNRTPPLEALSVDLLPLPETTMAPAPISSSTPR